MKGMESLSIHHKLLKTTIYSLTKKPVTGKTSDNRKDNHGKPRNFATWISPGLSPNYHTSRVSLVFYYETIESSGWS